MDHPGGREVACPITDSSAAPRPMQPWKARLRPGGGGSYDFTAGAGGDQGHVSRRAAFRLSWACNAQGDPCLDFPASSCKIQIGLLLALRAFKPRGTWGEGEWCWQVEVRYPVYQTCARLRDGTPWRSSQTIHIEVRSLCRSLFPLPFLPISAPSKNKAAHRELSTVPGTQEYYHPHFSGK